VIALRIIPVGDNVPLGLLDRLAAVLAARFGINCHVDAREVPIGVTWDSRRNQYYSTALLKELALRADEGTHGATVIGVANCDLYVPVLTFVFGEAQLDGRAALASLFRLREEFYGLPPNDELTFDRLEKEVVHELGHTMGLRHCQDWRCVMASSHGVERVDVKSADFCDSCRAQTRQG